MISDDEEFEAIAQGIRKRQRVDAAIDAAIAAQKANNKASAPAPPPPPPPPPPASLVPNPIRFTHFTAARHGHVQPATLSPTRLPAASPKANECDIPEYAKVTNMTLKHLLNSLMQNEEHMVMDPAECGHTGCAYCTGCLMGQRYALTKRLVQIEHTLYGTYP